MPDLLKALRAGRVLLIDGAMGTQLQRAGIRPGECYEAWNLTDPQFPKSRWWLADAPFVGFRIVLLPQ